MNKTMLQVALTALVGGAAGAGTVLLLAPSPGVGEPLAPIQRQVPAAGVGGGGPVSLDEGIRMRVARLEAELGALQAQVGQDASARRPAGPRDGSGGAAAGLPVSPLARGEDAFLEEVSKAMARIDEQKAAAARAKEMENRKVEEAKAFEEYEDIQASLAERVAKLAESMPMGTADRRELEGLMDLQVERMRDLTRAWASGEFTDEEVRERFMAERQQHREAAIALLGEQRIGAYQKFIQDGGVGGRYSFYLAPWESWAAD